MSDNPISVCIAIPSGDQWHMWFGYSLAQLMHYTSEIRPDIKMHLTVIRGSLIPKQRQALAEHALEKTDATHILFLDADMKFPRDTLIRLVNHELTAVCGSYTERQPPFRPVAFANPEYTERVWPHPEQVDLVPIAACGLGCFLVKTDAVRAMQKPWFSVATNPTGEFFVGEDIYFCRKLADMGIPLVLDQQLTNELMHCGSYEFRATDAVRWREQAEQRSREETQAYAEGNGKPKLVIS